jgi:hypothetical protein
MPCRFLLLYVIGQVFVESLEALFPERAMLRDPVGGGGERFRIETAVVDASFAAALQESGLLEDFHVLGHGRERDLEGFRELGHVRLAEREPREDGAPRWVGECGERAIERGRGRR